MQENDESLYKAALEQLRKTIRESTSSMTSVPKPLKFLMPHYAALKAIHEKMKDNDCQVQRLSLN
jgi:26S proteasome regulatory subunit N1